MPWRKTSAMDERTKFVGRLIQQQSVNDVTGINCKPCVSKYIFVTS